jgi:predicted DNA-binding transcriptional regulator YafY
MGSGPRHEKAELVLRLALMMQSSRTGLSLSDIQEKLEISRRTAERLRDAVERVFPQMEMANEGEKTKRWRLPQGVLSRLTALTAEQLTDMNTAVSLLKREGLSRQAHEIEKLRLSLIGAQQPEHLHRLEPDLEALTVAEGIAMRPGPRSVVHEETVSVIRSAILNTHTIRMQYKSRGSKKPSWQIVHPYGLLYGRKSYLVAYIPSVEEWRLRLLPNIIKIKETPEGFTHDPGFSLEEYAARSFGIFQEDPFDVVLRFPAAYAGELSNHHFHPTQKIEKEKGGDVIVRFRAGGLKEICWHLFTWGKTVHIVKPQALKDLMRKLCEEAISVL